LIFTSEGDLWTVTLPAELHQSPKLIAHRLTSGAGEETRAQISADGSRIAFSAEYDGNVDVYVMPIDGGAPTRLTYHPGADAAIGFSSNQQDVIFTSARSQPLGRPELWSVPISGGMPTRFNFGECTMASFSSTGKRIVFTRWSTEDWSWKRYRGGTAPEIWIGDLAVGSFRNISNHNAGDQFPMWLAGRVFFASDRTGVVNLFSMQPDGSDVKQHTNFAPVEGQPTAIEGYDVRWPSADARRDGTRIVFAQAGALALLNVTDSSITRLNIELASDRIAQRERFTASAAMVTDMALSPDGDRLVVGARGEVLVLPVEGGAPVQITRSGHAREVGASFLDDDTLVLISDAAGEQQIAAAPADGSDLPGLITTDREDWLFAPVASPTGKHLAFADKTLRLHIVDVSTLMRRQVDQSDVGEIRDYRFSPDGNWLAYVKPLTTGYRQIHLYSLRTNTVIPVGDGMYDDFEPRWDPAGQYLYFLSKRRFHPTMDEFDYDFIHINSTGVFVIPLAEATPPPLADAARAGAFDLATWGTPAEMLAEEADDEDALDDEFIMQIDIEGMADRVQQLPIEPGELEQLEAIVGGVCYLRGARDTLLEQDWAEPPSLLGKLTLVKHDLVNGEEEVLAEHVDAYTISRDSMTMCWPNETGFHLHDLSGLSEGHDLPIAELQLRVDARAEWQHIFAESWRLQRDFFWAPNMLGTDWEAIREKYAALLPRVGNRAELNDLIGEMIGELGCSHAYIWGGDAHEAATPVTVGLLGADVSMDSSGAALRIDRIIRGPSWDDSMRSPLQAAHLGVREGQFITAINGERIERGTRMFDLTHDLAGKIARITIADDPAGSNARTIETTLLGDEEQLRYWDWVETNRKYVADATDGAVGYMHMPDMDGPGLSAFARQFYPQFNKKALIIDVRSNGGGFVSQMIIQRLSRAIMAFGQPRTGATERYPYRAVHAHMACLIDEHAGSDGDIFPAAFRMRGLGPLIGTRTWGGVIGIRADKMHVDFGLSTQPEYAWWEAEHGWSIENVGVAPDIEVIITPEDRMAGRDPQLDRAIAELMKKLEEDPKELPAVPDWPVR